MRRRQCACMRWYATRPSGVPRSVTLVDRVLADRLARGGVPLLPFLRALRLAVGVQQQSPAERAPAALAAQQVPGRGVDREAVAASPLLPVPGEGGVVGGRPPGDHPVPDDFRPGELAEVEAGFPASEHPLVLPGRVEHAEVPGDDPAPRLVRVGELRPFPGESPQVGVQRAVGALGYPDPVIRGPAGDDRVEPGDQRVRVGPAQGGGLGGQSFPDPSHCLLARLGQELAVGVAADAEPEEVEPLAEVDDPGLGLVEREAPGLQPPGEPFLDLLGLRAGRAQYGQVIGVPDQDRRSRDGAQGGAALPVPDPGRLLHAVQRHVHDHGADHAALGYSLPGQRDPAVFHHARPSATGGPVPWRETSPASGGCGHG